MTIEQVDTAEAVEKLVAGLCDPARVQPWCVVSTPFDPTGFRFDVERIDEQVGDLCRVFTLETGELSRLLAAGMPERTEVYGGATRSFPPGAEWMLEPRRTQIRFIQLPSQILSMTERVIGDLFTMAYQSGITQEPEPLSRRESGTVKGIVAGTRAMVDLDSGEFATIVHELTYPEAPLDWVIHPGQRVSGSFDPETKRLTPDSATATASQLLEWYPHREVTLALVVAVERQRATVAVHPAIRLDMERRDISSNPRDRVDLLFTPGDVIRVRVIRDERGRIGLRSHDIDDEEPVKAAQSVFVGGSPWLQEDRIRFTAEEQPAVVSVDDLFTPPSSVVTPESLSTLDTSPAAVTVETLVMIPSPRPGPGARVAFASAPPNGEARQAGSQHADAQHAVARPAGPSAGSDSATDGGTVVIEKRRTALHQALLRIDVLQGENDSLKAAQKRAGGQQALNEIQELRLVLGEVIQERDAFKARAAESERARREVQATRRSELSTKNLAGDPLRSRDRFANDEDWVRHAIELAWIHRLDAADRLRFPLSRDYIVGPKFVESLANLESGQLNKALKTVVDVVSGYVGESAVRQVHALREGNGAAEDDVVRDDGARCMRAYIEQNTPSARRLHFWKIPPGRIELSRIVLHDDVRP